MTDALNDLTKNDPRTEEQLLTRAVLKADQRREAVLKEMQPHLDRSYAQGRIDEARRHYQDATQALADYKARLKSSQIPSIDLSPRHEPNE